jgi:flavin reductase (DIM6/NTAB) family NADH-FMN oxidoreductase RutF
MSVLDSRELRQAFGRFLTGVTVVTTLDTNGQAFGFTANSFTSVSLDPPLLLVCPGRFLSSFAVFQHCSHFAISILAEGQEDVSNTFASFQGDRFAASAWQPDGVGLPLIDGAAAHFSCKTAQVIPAGDHSILLGEVIEFGQSGARGLGYAAGEYFSLSLEREAAAAPLPGRRVVAGAIIEHDGKVLLMRAANGLQPLQLDLAGRAQVRQTLQHYLDGLGLDVRLGKAYSLFDDLQTGTHYHYFLARAATDFTDSVGEFFPVTELHKAHFVSQAHATMLARFALEHEAQRFSLYVGDESDGDIHSLLERS